MSRFEETLDKFNEKSIVYRLVVGCCAVFIVLMIITVLVRGFLGLPMDSFVEEVNTEYKDFVVLDTDGDGALSFDEVKHYDHNSEFSISESDLKSMFDRADKNGNGVLIGGEYDSYVIKVKSFLKDLKKQKEKAQKEAEERAKNASKSSSSNSNPFALRSSSSSDGDGAETCPYCGSEAIYESGGGYRCADCGRSISNPDDLNLNYEEGYYDLALPSFYYSINQG